LSDPVQADEADKQTQQTDARLARIVMVSTDLNTDFGKHYMENAIMLNPDASFSNSELIRLGAWYDEHGFEHSLRTLSGLIGRFYRETGRMPVDAHDVITAFPVDSVSPHLKDANWANLLGNLYDPITGSLYTNFQAPIWKPGTVNIEYFDDPQRAEKILLSQHPGIEFESGKYERPKTALHMTVYGETEDSILYDGWFY
jgi:hypothetical protein